MHWQAEHLETIWQFRTKRFRVTVYAITEPDLDLSWDDTGEVRDKLDSGEYVAFCAYASLEMDGKEIASDYLGNCIYEDYATFRDHIGIRAHGPGYGSYFSDMVSEVCQQGRAYIRDNPLPYIRAA